MVTKLSLLVHAGAPSKRSDDDRARVLAEAYLGFTGRVVSEQTYKIPELAVSQQVSQHHNDAEDVTKYPTQLLRSTPPAREIEDDVSMPVLQPAYDNTTFLEDTQDAYAALESQLQTSSLGISDFTPLKRRAPESFDADSPWPEDLDRHSPVKAAGQPFVHDEDQESLEQSQQLSLDEVSLQQSQQFSPEKDDGPILNRSQPVVERPVKKPRLQQRRVPAPPVFKPFRPPTITRAVSDVTRAITPEAVFPLARVERRSVSQTSESQDSYLKTPILVTPSQGWGTKVGKPCTSRAEHTEKPADAHRTEVPCVPYIPFPPEDGTGVAFIGDGDKATHQTPEQRHSQFSGSAPDTTSELPTSYSLSDITSQSSRARARQRESQRSVSDPGAIGSNGREDGQGQGQGEKLSGGGDARAKVRSQLGKEEMGDVELAVLEKRTDRLANSAPGTRAGTTRPATRPATPANSKATKDTISNVLPNKPAAESPFADLPLTIRPPEPEVAIDGFTTHITPTLSWLASSDKIKDVYTPISVSRSLLPLERGYWLIDPSPWPTEAQIAFWRFLENKVGSGDVGWGVWCIREGGEGALGKVQVFCWGECVREVYLMLYVASTSRVRKCGLRWVDSEGEVVVRMRGGGGEAGGGNG
ncbi:hypothetical protein LTR56_000093 [Elasticomyces elasticus]|nr:hypothetical protein LTR56_000093 [Elasticomyces elasticus]KAK3667081.1 hypothetical protein LTR22_001945 [Elasticomyces elasticus]KAK4932856.1 hypothetical protein LTR49_000812 [Elasticomyces elasticus]KAK5768740.1 hypothetical protein LTS12_001166 [Elasticomyces elasticus]